MQTTIGNGTSITSTLSDITKQTSKNLADYTTSVNSDDVTGSGNVADLERNDVDTTQISEHMEPDEQFLTAYDGKLTNDTTNEVSTAALVFTEINNQVKLYLLAFNDNKYAVWAYSDATQIQDNTNILSNFADETLNAPQYIIDLLGTTVESKIQL